MDLSKDFIYIFFYFSETNNDHKLVLAKIKKEVYIIKRLKIKILISNNILVFEILVLSFIK